VKIGFLATSGLRVVDSRLIELGMRMPGIVQRAQAIASLPSLGLLYLAAVTPPGHELKYWETLSVSASKKSKAAPRLPKAGLPPEALECDLVAISALSAQAFEAYALADQLRAAGVKVAIGGLHASVLPDEALAHADYVVIGEGDNVWPELVRAVEAGAARPCWNGTEFPPVDISRLPLPRYELLGERPYQRYSVQTARGCPWRCDFCASNVMLGLPYRKRSPAGVRRDIERLLELYRRPFIEFADDNTFVDKAWGKRLCREIAPLRVPWFAETDLTVADDEELLEAMRESGCRQVLIGFESPDPSALRGVELRSDFKARHADRSRAAIETIQAHGIAVNACFVLGLDGHDHRIFEQVLDFVDEAQPFDVQITVLTPFPGTPLYARLLAQGRIIEPGRWDLCTLFDVNFAPSHMSPDELRSGMYWLAERLYNEPAAHARQARFFAHWDRLRIRA
jgi:radical SAM superfamily enzyme YgiQ (UPF0313 family)